MTDIDRSIVRKMCLKNNIPITEFLLKTFYEKIGSHITLLGVSPISRHIVRAALLSARECSAPMMFIASLNQVDFDIGYTGWTPESFIKFINEEIERFKLNIPIIIGLDHCGPWLKDLHIQKKYDFDEAMESTRKSLEAALIAGYDIIHIDTTVDPYIGNPSTEIVAERTISLLEYAEDFRKNNDIPPVNYEIGSDRWIFKDERHTRDLISMVLNGLKKRGLNDVKILFMVGDVDTKVTPGNRLNVEKARRLVDLASKYGLYLKTHSTDYVENPEVFPQLGIGGANIGPMFADIEYRVIKKLAFREEELLERNIIEKSSKILDILFNSIVMDGRWRKYSEKDLRLIPRNRREFIIGLCSRYVLSKIDGKIFELLQNLSNIGINGEKVLLDELKNVIKGFLKSFNLCNVNKKILEYYGFRREGK